MRRFVMLFLQRGRERRGGRFDGGSELREHGDDTAEHGGGEEDGEERSLVHGCAFLMKKVGFKKLFSEIGCLRIRIS